MGAWKEEEDVKWVAIPDSKQVQNLNSIIPYEVVENSEPANPEIALEPLVFETPIPIF